MPVDLPDWVGTFANGAVTLTLALDDQGRPQLVDEEQAVPLVRLDLDIWAIPTPAGPVPVRLTRVGGEAVIFTGGAVYGRFDPETSGDA
jgi:hypothetical protein